MAQRPDLSFPQGTELVFGPQAQRRQYVSDSVAAVMRGWGFCELILPAFDSPATFGQADEAAMVQFTDREGRRMALRADFTQIAAKALALELKREPREIRACYEGRVYRYASSGHGARIESTQRGLEWVNATGTVFDAATITIARECLRALAVKDAVVVVGHAGFMQEVLGRGILEPNLFEALDHKNPARIRDLCQRYGLQAERAKALEALPMLTGGPEVIQRARALDLAKFLDDKGAKALQALSELDELAQLLAAAGVQQGVIFDLGEVRSFQYYSGFTFRIYHPLLGEDLGGGGRYDGLFDRFKMSVPAVGFGLNLARLAEVTQENPYAADGGEVIDASRGAAALKRLALLRAQGKPVILKGGA